MVGKGVEPKSSRIFHQCYVKCCKLQNLTPISNVLPSLNGRVLDFCVDRIKYADWPPILNALSCDLSLHSVAIRCRQPVKTVLEQIDCERLAKTVNKRAVILTNFMLSNLVEAISQLLSNTTLLNSIILEGLPLKIPYLNPFCEALLENSSLQHVGLPRCLLGDAGCLALCKAVRCMPNILTLDLSGCELTALGAGYIADLLKYQKIHRYSENWVHTLRYRLPELDAMAGLRRITLCGNPGLGDLGVGKLLEVLSDDLWIKALDIQNCGISDEAASKAVHTLASNTTLVVLDMRHNPDVSCESLSAVRGKLRQNEQRGIGGQYLWIAGSGSSSDGRSTKSVKNGLTKERDRPNTRSGPTKWNGPAKTTTVKKERDNTEMLEEQLQEEISHRQQLEELNLQLVDQMKQLKQQQLRLWSQEQNSSGSERSFQASSRSFDMSSSSGTSSVPIDQNTLSYIQQAFKDIYSFIKNNQCQGQCLHESHEMPDAKDHPPAEELADMEEYNESGEMRINIMAKKARSAHQSFENVKDRKVTKSAHMLGIANGRDGVEMKPEMIERQMGDTKTAHVETHSELMEEMISAKSKRIIHSRSGSSCCVSDSSDTLVCTPHTPTALTPLTPVSPPAPPEPRPINPRDAFYSSDDSDGN